MSETKSDAIPDMLFFRLYSATNQFVPQDDKQSTSFSQSSDSNEPWWCESCWCFQMDYWPQRHLSAVTFEASMIFFIVPADHTSTDVQLWDRTTCWNFICLPPRRKYFHQYWLVCLLAGLRNRELMDDFLLSCLKVWSGCRVNIADLVIPNDLMTLNKDQITNCNKENKEN